MHFESGHFNPQRPTTLMTSYLHCLAFHCVHWKGTCFRFLVVSIILSSSFGITSWFSSFRNSNTLDDCSEIKEFRSYFKWFYHSKVYMFSEKSNTFSVIKMNRLPYVCIHKFSDLVSDYMELKTIL